MRGENATIRMNKTGGMRMDRLETVRAFVFQAYASIQDDALRHLAIAHAAECAAIAALLADRFIDGARAAFADFVMIIIALPITA